MNKEFLTIKETATILSVTTLTLRNWDKSGRLTASRHPINNYRVYKKVEIDMLLDDIRNGHWKIRKQNSQYGKSDKEARKISIKHLDD